jgi:hypothetical protein
MTNKNEWNKRHNFAKDSPHSKTEISKISKIPKKVLDEVESRGLGAYKTNYRSVREKKTGKKGTNAPPSKKMSPQQWGHSRIFSFVNKIEGRKKLNHDRDLLDDIPRLRGKNKDII